MPDNHKNYWTSTSFYGSLKGDKYKNQKTTKINGEIKAMDSAQNQLAAKLKESNNILVTVSRNPSVDQLSACLGLTLLLNKMGKHAAAVFSGEVPSTIEFLQPEDTLEKNTDSLRDFIIALDKSKADKLRYKVEDDVVRIFITPYKTSISEQDLEFSQGDFNVDVVVALGVQQQEDLDEAITTHGRILHDATVSSINTSADGGLGSINWHDDTASSLSELVTELAQIVGAELIDNQIATALLTGIVAETDRFSNDKTSSQTMSASAALMSAGANQQLVASKLQEPEVEVDHSKKSEDLEDSSGGEDGDEPKADDGTLDIEHDTQPEDDKPEETPQEPELELPAPEETPPVEPETPAEQPAQEDNPDLNARSVVTEPPSLGGTLTANSQPEGLDPVTDPMSMPASEDPQMLDRATTPNPGLSPTPTDWTPPAPVVPQPQISEDGTLTDLEASVNSPHLEGQQPNQEAGIDGVRDEVNRALAQNPPATQPPIEALGAQPMADNLQQPQPPVPAPTPVSEPPVQQPEPVQPPTPVEPQQQPTVTDPNAPPPVPPPIPFQFGTPSSNNQQQ